MSKQKLYYLYFLYVCLRLSSTAEGFHLLHFQLDKINLISFILNESYEKLQMQKTMPQVWKTDIKD